MSTANFSTISAVTYVRKSTGGEDADGQVRQEASLPQQLNEIAKLKPEKGGSYQIIRRYEDDGVSGWKRGAARPDFARMLADCQERRDVQAILCDDLDRFSRANPLDVMADYAMLRSAGVRYIHACSQRSFDLNDPEDMGMIISLTAYAYAANDYSRKLGRRMCISRRDRASRGKFSGGQAPYGMVIERDYTPEGKAIKESSRLAPGDPAEVEILKWIFERYAAGKSPNWIVEDLNKRGIKTRRGGPWHTTSLRFMLSNRAYIGEFVYGTSPAGQFVRLIDGEIVKAEGLPLTKNSAPFAAHKDAWPAIIDPATFAKVQARLARFAGGKLRDHTKSYLLSSILVCGHCGNSLHGNMNGKQVVYRCSGYTGSRICGCQKVREDEILPQILTMLGEEVEGLLMLKAKPPAAAQAPATARAEIEKQVAALQAKIAIARKSKYETEDAATRQETDKDISDMRRQIAELQAQVITEVDTEDAEDAQREELRAWFSEFYDKALRVPVGPDATAAARAAARPLAGRDWELSPLMRQADGQRVLLADKAVLRQALLALGTCVELHWSVSEEIRSNGPRKRYTLEKGRFRLGQRTAEQDFANLARRPRRLVNFVFIRQNGLSSEICNPQIINPSPRSP